jgi:hemolysin activation/secretion protein
MNTKQSILATCGRGAVPASDHRHNGKLYRRAVAAAAATFLLCQSAWCAEHFAISAFTFEGNQSLPGTVLAEAVAPLVGADRDIGDLRRAQVTLEDAYRRAGYAAVRVRVPPQELTGGVVRIVIEESALGAVTVLGSGFHDDANVRASLPMLVPGGVPNLVRLSAGLQLANENPSRRLDVTLAPSEAPGRVDATVAVVDRAPFMVTTSFDNTGTPESGRWRLGVALQHADLFNRDQVATMAYTTSTDSPHGVHVDLWSLGYRLPFYGLGDSLELVYGHSSVNTPGSSPTLGGVLGIVGKGDVLGVRWNQFLPRNGNLTTKIVYSIERRHVDSRCSIDGVSIDTSGPTPPLSSCLPYTTMPLSVTLAGRWEGVTHSIDGAVGLSRNLPSGAVHTNIDGRVDRYSYLTSGNRQSRDGFMAVHAVGNVLAALPRDWQVRVAGSAQLANAAVVSTEQLGLTGAASVRGFDERVVATDSGLVVNAELYSPDLAAATGTPGALRLLGFYDAARGANHGVRTGVTPARIFLDSAGVGLRYTPAKNIDLRADVARVLNVAPALPGTAGTWRAHIGLVAGF